MVAGNIELDKDPAEVGAVERSELTGFEARGSPRGVGAAVNGRDGGIEGREGWPRSDMRRACIEVATNDGSVRGSGGRRLETGFDDGRKCPAAANKAALCRVASLATLAAVGAVVVVTPDTAPDELAGFCAAEA